MARQTADIMFNGSYTDFKQGLLDYNDSVDYSKQIELVDWDLNFFTIEGSMSSFDWGQQVEVYLVDRLEYYGSEGSVEDIYW
mgnify:CR=1 FL=1